MNPILKTKEDESAEETESLKHGIAFVKPPKTEHEAMTEKDYGVLREEFSLTDGGIEIEKTEQKPEAIGAVTEEEKGEEEKDIQRVSENKVIILPESHKDTEFSEDEDLFNELNKRR
jgi:hypothetical protein